MHLSVITATRSRPELLVQVLDQFQKQSLGGLVCEHLVVSDGRDPRAHAIAGDFGARYLELDPPAGQWGAGAKDLGMRHAIGEYVCFWDDDNLYEPHALVTAYSAACHHDIGVVRTQYRFRKRIGWATIPRNWDGHFRAGDIDTMCFCVRREFAVKEAWVSENAKISNDHGWITKLMCHNPRVNYVPVVIGRHV